MIVENLKEFLLCSLWEWTKQTLVWIPRSPEKLEKILHRLGVQNKGLYTKEWRVEDSKQASKEQQLVILIDFLEDDGRLGKRKYQKMCPGGTDCQPTQEGFLM